MQSLQTLRGRLDESTASLKPFEQQPSATPASMTRTDRGTPCAEWTSPTREPDSAVEVGKLDGHRERIPACVVRLPFYDPEKKRVRS